jgi:hypothetical protein
VDIITYDSFVNSDFHIEKFKGAGIHDEEVLDMILSLRAGEGKTLCYQAIWAKSELYWSTNYVILMHVDQERYIFF